MTRKARRCGWLWLALAVMAAVGAGIFLLPGGCPAQTLTVDVSQGNSPYTVGTDISNAREYIGTTAAGGVLNQDAHTNKWENLPFCAIIYDARYRRHFQNRFKDENMFPTRKDVGVEGLKVPL